MGRWGRGGAGVKPSGSRSKNWFWPSNFFRARDRGRVGYHFEKPSSGAFWRVMGHWGVGGRQIYFSAAYMGQSEILVQFCWDLGGLA